MFININLIKNLQVNEDSFIKHHKKKCKLTKCSINLSKCSLKKDLMSLENVSVLCFGLEKSSKSIKITNNILLNSAISLQPLWHAIMWWSLLTKIASKSCKAIRNKTNLLRRLKKTFIIIGNKLKRNMRKRKLQLRRNKRRIKTLCLPNKHQSPNRSNRKMVKN